jgi:hypothetical protein
MDDAPPCQTTRSADHHARTYAADELESRERERERVLQWGQVGHEGDDVACKHKQQTAKQKKKEQEASDRIQLGSSSSVHEHDCMSMTHAMQLSHSINFDR